MEYGAVSCNAVEDSLDVRARIDSDWMSNSWVIAEGQIMILSVERRDLEQLGQLLPGRFPSSRRKSGHSAARKPLWSERCAYPGSSLALPISSSIRAFNLAPFKLPVIA